MNTLVEKKLAGNEGNDVRTTYRELKCQQVSHINTDTMQQIKLFVFKTKIATYWSETITNKTFEQDSLLRRFIIKLTNRLICDNRHSQHAGKYYSILSTSTSKISDSYGEGKQRL